VQHDVQRSTECRKISPYRLAHTALDPVAIYRFAHYLTHCEAHTGATRILYSKWLSIGSCEWAHAEKITHLFRELLSAGLIDALIISMFAKPED
jgi:hypothetical protein